MSVTLLDGVPKEGEVLPVEVEPQKASEEKETPSDSSTDKETEAEKAPTSEGAKENTPDELNVPFHKHPRWKQMYESNRELQETNRALQETVESLQGAMEEIKTRSQASQSTTPIPAWFSRVYGDDASAWSDYQSHEQSNRQSIKEEVIKEWEGRQQAQSKAQEDSQKKWNTWIDTEFEKLVDDGVVQDSEKNEVINAVLKYSPIDETGYYSMKKAAEIYNALKSSKKDDITKERKEIAAKTTSSPRAEVRGSKVMTRRDLANKDFLDLVKEE